MRETAASVISDGDCTKPSGTPNRTEVSTSDNISSSESDQSSSLGGAIVGVDGDLRVYSYKRREGQVRMREDGGELREEKKDQKSMNGKI